MRVAAADRDEFAVGLELMAASLRTEMSGRTGKRGLTPTPNGIIINTAARGRKRSCAGIAGLCVCQLDGSGPAPLR